MISPHQLIGICIASATIGAMLAGWLGYTIGWIAGHAEGSIDTADEIRAAMREPGELRTTGAI